MECDKSCKSEADHVPKGKLKSLDFPRLTDTQTLCLGTDGSITFYFTCLERVLLPGSADRYCFPLLKTRSRCLGVNPQPWCSWSSKWSPVRWQSPRKPNSVLSVPLDRPMPSASTSGEPTCLHVLLYLFLEPRPESGPLYLSYHFADEIRIFLFCALFI